MKLGPCVDGDDGRRTIVGELLDQQFHARGYLAVPTMRAVEQ
jgi:hypothetical protein